MNAQIVYHYRGQIERGNGQPGYDWHAGYSETNDRGEVLYPWMTRAECQRDAKNRKAIAVFSSDLPAQASI